MSTATASRADRSMKLADTFVLIADDSPAQKAEVPPRTGGKDTIASIQHALLSADPYRYTLDDLIYEVHIRHRNVDVSDAALAQEFRVDLLDRAHACMRASPLPKKYGWGVHYDDQGRIAIYPVQSAQYRAFARGGTDRPQVFKAMRSARA
jgi:Family of unknown function (DUF6157)